METSTIISTSLPTAGTEEQLVNGKSVVGQASAEQEQVAQASTGACPVDDDLYSMQIVDCTSTAKKLVAEVDAEFAAEASEGKAKELQKKAPVTKDYTPVYSEAEKAKLEAITKVCEAEISRVISDPRYCTTPFADGKNCIIDLRKAFTEGKIQFVTPVINRTHGNDETKTGESLLTYGAQHILIVLTVKMASEAGILPTHFAKSQQKKNISDDDLLMMDGNGRINFLHGIEPEDWPEIYGVFPSPDKAGLYNLSKAFDIINTQVSVWKTQDMVQKRLLSEGEKSHPGWQMINTLVNKGYMYQAACELATLKTDRVKKAAVSAGDADAIFIHYESAEKIHKALVQKFGEGEDKVLKTKAFPMAVASLWTKLQVKFADEKATEYFLGFVENLDAEKIDAIKNAKSERGKASKDEKRKSIIHNEFYEFVKSKGMNIE